MLPPSPITSSCHVLAHSTMFFCAILYRRQIWIERSCCARNWQLRWWAPKGLHRIYVEQQQLSSLPSLKEIRQKPVSTSVWDSSPFLLLMYTFVYLLQGSLYIGNREHLPYFILNLRWRNIWRKRNMITSWDVQEMCKQSKKRQYCCSQICSTFIGVHNREREKLRKTRDEKLERYRESSECRVDLKFNTTLHWLVPLARSYFGDTFMYVQQTPIQSWNRF